jgi:hypothetical protein
LSPKTKSDIAVWSSLCCFTHSATPSKKKSADQLSASPAGNVKLEQFAIRQWWFEKTLPAKLDKAEADWHATQPTAPKPIIVEYPRWRHEYPRTLET